MKPESISEERDTDTIPKCAMPTIMVFERLGVNRMYRKIGLNTRYVLVLLFLITITTL